MYIELHNMRKNMVSVWSGGADKKKKKKKKKNEDTKSIDHYDETRQVP